MAIISRAQAVKRKGGGRRSVIYRDTRGRTREAVVVSAGAGADQLNLRIPSNRKSSGLLTNVDKATSLKQTNVWYLPRP